MIESQQPLLMYMSPHNETSLDFCAEVAYHQMMQNRHFIVELPESSSQWNNSRVKTLSDLFEPTWDTFHVFCFRSEGTPANIRPATAISLCHNMKEELQPVFRQCAGKHDHEPPTNPSDSWLHPWAFCSNNSDSLVRMCGDRPEPAQLHFMADLIEMT